MEVVRSNEEAEDEEIRDRHWAKHYLILFAVQQVWPKGPKGCEPPLAS